MEACLKLVFCVIFFNCANACVKNSCSSTTVSECGCDVFCGEEISVTLRVQNIYNGSNDRLATTLNSVPQRELIYMMQAAVEQDPTFKYTATFFQQWGYYIETLNGVSADPSKKLFWQLYSVTKQENLQEGVSSYIPMDNEIILFNYTTWASLGDEHDNA